MQALTRIKKNSAYFRVNYLLVMLATCAATFALHPTALIVLGLVLAGWIWALFIRTTPIVISGRTLSDRETMLGLSAISFITIFFLTRYGSHGSMHEREHIVASPLEAIINNLLHADSL